MLTITCPFEVSEVMQACVTQRKQGKKLAVYDLSLVVSWTGKMVVADSKSVDGVRLSDFSIMHSSNLENG